MKRWIFKLAIFLLLGAIVNVAVAWGCANIPRPSSITHRTTTRAENVAHIADYFDVQQKDSSYHGYIMRAVSFKIQYASRSVNDPWDYDRVAQIESGWPMRSLIGEWMSDYEDQVNRSWFVTALMNPWLSDKEQELNFIPYRPMWPNFALNTMFYGAILWIPFAPFALRRVSRRRRGACVKCGYDLSHVDHEVCPECGKELCKKKQS